MQSHVLLCEVQRAAGEVMLNALLILECTQHSTFALTIALREKSEEQTSGGVRQSKHIL